MCLLLSLPALAQNNPDDTIFGDTIVTDIENSDANPAKTLLESDKVVIGGRFSVSAQVNLDPNATKDGDVFSSGLIDLSTRLFLDARPSSDFRAFVKGDLSYKTSTGVNFELREVFADIDLYDTVFLRAGKQTINWGVGFFFSPANLINLERVNPEDPEAELAGPVAVKAQLPIGTDNLTGYLLMSDIESGIDIGLASRYEFLVEGYEVTVGGIYQPDNPWAVMATGSGSIGDVAVFAEAVLQGNSNKVFVIKDPDSPSGVGTETRKDAVFFSGTVGGRYNFTTEDQLFSVSASAQYFFNGLGYDDNSVFTGNRAGIAELIGKGELSINDLRERGKHNAAVSVSANDIGGTDLTPSLFWLGNLSDGSGIVNASLQYRGIDFLTPRLSYRFNYGPEGAENSVNGISHSLSVGFSLSGSF